MKILVANYLWRTAGLVRASQSVAMNRSYIIGNQKSDGFGTLVG